MNKAGSAISIVAGIGLSVVTLYFAFRNVPFLTLTTYLKSIQWLWMVPSVGLILVSFFLRVFRWQIILNGTFPVRFSQVFHPLMIGFMMNSVLPGRVGELARPLILQQKHKVPFSTGVATVATERILDLAMLMGLFIMIAGMVQIDPGHDIIFGGYHLNMGILLDIRAAMVRFGAVLLLGMILINSRWVRQKLKWLIQTLPEWILFFSHGLRKRVSEKLCQPLCAMVDHFAQGMILIKQPVRLGLCLVITLMIWGIQALSMHVLAVGCPGISLSFMEIVSMMVIICFFIALPSVPGYWGVWEAGGVFILTVFGISSKQAVGFTLANHVVQLVPVIIVGLMSAISIGVDIRHMGRIRSDDCQNR